jgi:acyl-CoA synthetase (AMP-forming)/AMP-acid ligase II
MGLIGGILQPIHRGFPVILLSPLAFLQRPMRWLRAISHYKASASGGPNFAYDLCARKATPEDIAALDLSHWHVAFNGAEPVRAKTMERFAKIFAPSGFKYEAFFPCYGLAEATLIVSGGERLAGPKNLAVQKGSVENNQAVVVEPTDDAQVLVGCGHTLDDQRIVIVDPDTLFPLPDRVVGEIWVKGDSISQGYWNNPEETEKTFGAYLADEGDGPYLRTGDLGFLDDGELYVSGRIKDLIIIDGLNHYPQDIEQTVESLHPAIRPGCSAAFSHSINGVEHLIVAVEVRKQYRPLTLSTDTSRQQLLDPEALKRDIRRAVSELHDLRVHDVVLLQSGSIAKTSSGKIQRHAVLIDYVNNALTHWES